MHQPVGQLYFSAGVKRLVLLIQKQVMFSSGEMPRIHLVCPYAMLKSSTALFFSGHECSYFEPENFRLL
jgi:hypothetical protein